MTTNLKLPTDFNTSVFDKFPHILENITMMWGDPQLLVYINSLIVETKRTDRQGFPFEVAMEIQTIKNYYEENVFAICKLNAHQQFEVNKAILRKGDAWKGR